MGKIMMSDTSIDFLDRYPIFSQPHLTCLIMLVLHLCKNIWVWEPQCSTGSLAFSLQELQCLGKSHMFSHSQMNNIADAISLNISYWISPWTTIPQKNISNTIPTTGPKPGHCLATRWIAAWDVPCVPITPPSRPALWMPSVRPMSCGSCTNSSPAGQARVVRWGVGFRWCPWRSSWNVRLMLPCLTDPTLLVHMAKSKKHDLHLWRTFNLYVYIVY